MCGGKLLLDTGIQIDGSSGKKERESIDEKTGRGRGGRGY